MQVMSTLLKRAVLKLMPALAIFVFTRRRQRQDKAYWASTSLGIRAIDESKPAWLKPKLLIVLPDISGNPDFGPAKGNYFFEIFTSAQERYGVDRVAAHCLSQTEDWIIQCRRIAWRLKNGGESHVLFYIESSDPNTQRWRWDVLANEIARSGCSTAAIGFLTDGTYELHQLFCRRFQQVYANSLFVQIDVKPSDRYVQGGRLIGPTFLPISRGSIRQLESHLLGVEVTKSFHLSFIGKMYGYRSKVLTKLVGLGLEVAINPHRSQGGDETISYLDYMAALHRSRFTINFARASDSRQKQLKSRILESVLAGSVPITDDQGLSEEVLPAGISVRTFRSAIDLLAIQETSESRSRIIERGFPNGLVKEEIRSLASSHFWQTIERGLESSGLPKLTPLGWSDGDSVS